MTVQSRLGWSGLVVATLVAVVVAVPDGSGAAPRAKAATKDFTATLRYADNSPATGPQTGTGTFSGKFTGRTARLVRALAAAAGIPYSALTKGGSYAARFTTNAKGDINGVFAAHMKSPGLGTLCASYRATHGKFNGGEFLPTSGTFTEVGGTGKLAKAHGGGSFDLTDVTGSSTEVFTAKGSLHASIGKARAPSAACKALLRG